MGSSRFSLIVLEELERAGFLPTLVITSPDQKKDRGQKIQPSLIKLWAEERKIEVFTPETLRGDDVEKKTTSAKAEVFITASYGKIIPKNILDIPKHGTLNVHPSLLPKLRGPSPIETTILEAKNKKETPDEIGVTIMLTDEKVDNGPIVAQSILSPEDLSVIENWPPYTEQLETILAHAGGILLVKTLPDWIAGNIKAKEQNHKQATFTKKFTKEDGLIDLSDDAQKNLNKIRALHRSPGTFFFLTKDDKQIRIRIKSADVKNGELMIDRVVPEGKKEMSYKDFFRGFRGSGR